MSQEDTVFRYIERAIQEHRLLPGTRLREVKLAEIFGVKRGLIRKVLTRLTHEKLVEHQPNVGAQVACPSIRDAQDLFATRDILENSIIEMLCGNLSKQQIKHLEDHCQRETEAYQQNHPQLGVRLSADFHRELVKLTGNSVLEEFLNEIINRTPAVIMSLQGENGSGCINHEHIDIVDALAKGNRQLAQDLMKDHLVHMQQMFHSEPPREPPSLEEVFDL